MAREAEAAARKRKAIAATGDEGSAGAVDGEQVFEEEIAVAADADAASGAPSSVVPTTYASDPNAYPDGSTSSCAAVADWCEDVYVGCFDDEVMQPEGQHIGFGSDVNAKLIPFIGDKEPLSALAAEFESGSPILQAKIKLLGEQYGAFRRSRGDGNCFYRSFMFSYLEHILVTQDRDEVNRVIPKLEKCKTILQNLGYIEFTFEDFFGVFMEQLENVLQGNKFSISQEKLLERSRDASISDYVVMCFRFVTSGEIQKRAEFFEPFVMGLTNTTVHQFCKSSVEPMGEESDQVHIIALSDALGVPVRVVYLDRSSCENGDLSVNYHDFVPALENVGCCSGTTSPKPFVTLLYRPGHYDILYDKQ